MDSDDEDETNTGGRCEDEGDADELSELWISEEYSRSQLE